MDIFELAYKIVGQGQAEAASGIAAVDAAGQQAAATLTATEAASAKLSGTLTAAQAAFARSQGGAQALAQSIAELDAAEKAWNATTASTTGPGLGTFNQVLGQTERSSLQTTRGLFLLDRALGGIVGSAIGASSEFTRLGEGLLLFSTGGHAATVALAAIAGVLLPLGFAYSLVTERTRTLDDAQQKLFQDLADGALKVDALTAATEGWHTAIAKLADDKSRLDRIEALFGPHGQGLGLLGALGPAGAAFALGGLVGTQQTANDQAKAEAAVSEGQRKATDELVAAKAKELQQLAESIKLGNLDATGRQRIAELLKDAVQLEQTGNLNREQRNRLEAAAQDITQAFAEIQRKATEEEKKRTAAIRDQQEALIKQASLAEQSLSVLGQTPERVTALRVALGNLTAATSEDNIARLVGLGLIQQAIQLLDAQKKAVQDLAAATKEAIPGRAAPSFGLGGVTTGAQGAPITFGQGISLAPPNLAALIPARDLFAPLEPEAHQAGFGLMDAFGKGMTEASAAAAKTARAAVAKTADALYAEAFQQQQRLTRLNQAFLATLTGFAESIASAFGGALAGTTNFGKALLAALGSAIASFGKALIAFAIQMELALGFLRSLNPLAALGIGIAMVALGSALGGLANAANSAFGGGGGVGGSSNTPVHVIVVGTSLGAAGRVQNPAPFVYAPTNIGVTDPVGQAQIARMVQLGQRRNLPSGI